MRSCLSVFLVVMTLSGCSQKLKIIARLPTTINESSGLTVNPDGTFWTHNDSGDQPRIYKLDSLGKLIKTIYLKGATAVDYEDITRDKPGNIYVCDCGNNSSNRQNLCIYKISNADIRADRDTVTPERIHFTYSDQSLFPPSKTKRNFDCEALVVYNDSIFLFSKNRGESEYCRRYILPTVQGSYTAILLDSVRTNRWITGAAISPDNKTLILLSENKLNIFTNFVGSNFFRGKHIKVGIPVTQKEGITFKTNSVIYITDEVFKGFGGKLYSINLSVLLK
jgi:uncharacterized protein YjiK